MKLGIFGAQQRGKLADSDPRLQVKTFYLHRKAGRLIPTGGRFLIS